MSVFGGGLGWFGGGLGCFNGTHISLRIVRNNLVFLFQILNFDKLYDYFLFLYLKYFS